MYNMTISIEFNEVVNNVKTIAREWRHQCQSTQIEAVLKNFCNFMDDVNFKMEFVDDTEGYVRTKMLDAMDYLKDNVIPRFGSCTITGKTFRSIYDVIKEFYFSEK